MSDFSESLVDIAKFIPLSLEPPNAWIGHLPFASWLIKAVTPKIFVELGTHSGNSYFSFCQAVDEYNIVTKCYAVDTWKGEEHSGFYGEEVFKKVFAYNQKRFSSFSQLLRMKFDEAVSYFSNESIELLHIDGLHTYESVKHDYETWFPKLAPGAVVLFHDTNVRERGFGVWKLWEELTEIYPNNIEFLHSNGLGVLQLNNGPEDKKLKWLSRSSPSQKMLKDYFSAIGEKQIEHFENSQLKCDVKNLNQTIDEQITNLSQALTDREKQVAELNLTVSDLNQTVSNLNQTVSDLNQRISDVDQTVAERNGQIAGLNQTTAELVTRIAGYKQELAERDALNKTFEQSICDKDNHIVNLEDLITVLRYEISALRHSTAWKITAPLRWSFYQLKRVKKGAAKVKEILVVNNGFKPAARKAWQVYQREGVTGIKRRFILVQPQNEFNSKLNKYLKVDNDGAHQNSYQEWVQRYDYIDEKLRQRIIKEIKSFSRFPKISVIMPVYDPPIDFLNEAIESVRNQLYPNWELCIADDASKSQPVRDLLAQHAQREARIKVAYRKNNGHISAASNSAIELASGDYAALLDHDDLLSENALFWVARTIIENPGVGLIYSDEDKITPTKERYEPYFKSEFNYELFLAQNMISHLGVYRRDLIDKIGGFRLGFEGSQDYDLALRVIEHLSTDEIKHIPKVLYHWRAITGSTALNSEEKDYASDAGRRAVADHLRRCGRKAKVIPAPDIPSMNRVRYAVPTPEPLVSIIIPTRDHAKLLSTCIDSIVSLSTYPAWEIIIIDNGSQEPETKRLLESLQSERINIIYDDSPFNFSRLNNISSRKARGDILCLLNNDIEIISHDWLEEMVSFALQKEIGCVGARLWYPDGRLQHGGVLLGIGGVANHAHYRQEKGSPGYFGRAVLHQCFSAVTAACLMVRREVYEKMGGLDESLAVAFNDIDFCLRVGQAGYRNIWTPYAEMIHHESISRGTEDNKDKQARFFSEVRTMQERWGEKLLNDPAYNPNLTLDHENFSLAWPPRVKPI